MLTHNRIAVDGEKLVTHRFKSGTIRMVTRDGFEHWLRSRGPRHGSEHTPIGSSIKGFVASCVDDFLTIFGFIDSDALPSEDEPQEIVEIPPDTLLSICDIPLQWQDRYHFNSCEQAFFSGYSSAGAPYGTLWFGNGVTMPIQLLDEAQNVRVIDRSWPEGLESL
jgi:hypothetical protein